MDDKPPVPQNWEGPEWIEIDGTMLPFVSMNCECPTPWLICTAYGWGRCKRCGTRPEVQAGPGQTGLVSGPR